MIAAIRPTTTQAARAGVPWLDTPARPRGPSLMSRLMANSSRDAPTRQARQHPKALIAAPRLTRVPTQDAM